MTTLGTLRNLQNNIGGGHGRHRAWGNGNRRILLRTLTLVLLLASATFPQVLRNGSALEELVDATVERARSEFNVPGISVAVVKDGKVVLAKGYGVRRMGTAVPMTENTRVGIASNTKAFTSAALAMLVDEGKLGWDDRVIDRCPSSQCQTLT